ncbi:MAG: hypothetical protein IJ453_05340 [Oscillospiraceae bacterium]|nr:hypothetical protein [Oscillospiraceae bacterium]
MSEYQKPYSILFRGITDALEELQRQNYGLAAQRLIQAQKDAEEAFLNWEETDQTAVK